MTINLADNNPRANYTATSNQTAFSIPFDYFDDGDVSVYVNGTLKTITTHYTLTTTTVTFTAGLTAGDKVGITRDVPLERTTDLTSTYNAVSINSQLDTIVAQIADLDDRVSRSISLNDYEVGVSLDLPATADRLGKTIQFNSSTGALEVGPSGDELTSIASISSEITALDGISADITSVAGAIANVNSVGSNISSVTSVAGSISNVNAVNTNITDVNSVAGSITDLNDVADSLDQVELVAGSISNVDIVGPAISNVNTVAGDISNINTVAGISANITTVAGITSAISTVNSNAADITSVSNNIDDVNDVANVITKVTTVADNIANVNTVAPAVTYVSTLANNISNINTLAPISADITAAVAIASDIEDAATNAAAAISAKTAAESARDATLSAFDSFDDRYLGAKTADPSVDNDGNALVGGALYYNSTDEVMKVYTGSAWVAAYASLSGALLVDNNLSDLANAASARTNLGLGTAATTAATDYVAVTGDSMTGNLSFGDNDKAIFGAGSDLQIYHDGNNSYIDDTGTGELRIRGHDKVKLQKYTGENFLVATADGSVTLNYDNAEKLATTSTGIDVTGTVTADGLTVQRGSGIAAQFTTTTHGDDVELQLSAENDSGASKSGQIFFDPDTNTIGFKNGGLKTLHTDSSGNVGIGDTAPSEKLNVAGNVMLEGGNQYLYLTNVGTGNSGIYIRGNTASSYLRSHTTGHFTWEVTGSEKMRIDSSGRVGIGTTSPAEELHIETTGGATAGIQLSTTGGAVDRDWKFLATAAAGTFYIQDATASVNRLAIDSSGNVGIGTSSPSSYNSNIDDLVVANSASGGITIATGTTSQGAIAFADGTSASDEVMGRIRYDHNVNEMDFRVNNAERMRIDSSGRVGIGTSSPNTPLHVSTAVTTKSVVETTGTSSDALIEFTRGQGSGNTWSVGLDQSNSSALSFAYLSNGSPSLTSHNKMTIDSSGNLLVGTTDVTLYDETSGGETGFALRSDGRMYNSRDGGTNAIFNRLTSDGDIMQFRKDGTSVGSIGSNSSGGQPLLDINASTTNSSQMRFTTSGSEAMRIDSSGNLLVGKTSTNYNADGFQAFAAGFVHMTADISSGSQVLTINRKTSDGDIAVFRKDGTTVGSIGTSGGATDFTITSNRTYLDLFTGGNSAGLTYRDDATQRSFRPWGSKDALIDLGASSNRFKDLYLSGGVYLGGTGSANHLDDYEEGTFTVEVSDGTTTVNWATAYYVKIGRAVMITGRLTNVPNHSSFTQTAEVRIGNLPFPSIGNFNGQPLSWRDPVDASMYHVRSYELNSTSMFLKNDANTNILFNDVQSTSDLFFTICYYTSS